MTTRPTVLVLAAGESSRLAPFNTDFHKGSLPLLGEPLIVRTLRNLEKHHCADVVIVVSERDFGGKGLSGSLGAYNLQLKIQFVLQPQADGMGDAVLRAADHIGEQFAVVFPVSLDAGEVIEELMKSSLSGGALTVTETSEPWRYGIVTVEGDRVISIIEKPAQGTEPSNLKAQGMYLLSREYLDVLRSTEPTQYSFEAALDTFFHSHEVGFYKQGKYLLSLKYPWHLFQFQKFLYGKTRSMVALDAQVAPTAVIDDSHGPVIIESGAKIGHAAKLLGPCYIGRHALVGDFSFVRGSSIEEDVVIGSYTEVVRSILFPNCEIHYGYIADSIVGHDARIGGGFLSANKRHDRENVKVMIKGEKVDAGTNALGAFIGDRAKVGVRTTTMPGVIIGAESVIYPSLTIYHNVERGDVLK